MRRWLGLIRNPWERARAVVVATTLLDRSGFSGDSARLASAAMERAWREYAHLLAGRRAGRPRPETMALFALALARRRGSLGERAHQALPAALEAGIGDRGLYAGRSEAWHAAVDSELLAFAQAVRRDPDGRATELPTN